MNEFKSEPAEIREAMLKAAKRVLDSGWYVLGNEVVSFERQWADICGTSHAIGVGNGMDAIEISLRALGIGPGDEVITTPMTAFASVLAILRAGAQPVLADINADTGLLCMESAARVITARTRAVLLVHLYGQVRHMSSWQAFCQSRQLELVEDCAQAHLAESNGKIAGSFGRVGAYSFYPTKNLGAPGDAGMIVCSEQKIAELSSQLRNYGQKIRYHHPVLGMNSRLDEIQAAMLSVRLQWLTGFTGKRQEIAEHYRAHIDNPLVSTLKAPEEKSAHVYHLFVVLCEQRDALQQHLRAAGVESLIHYPIPVHKQKPCLDIPRDPQGLAKSERHAACCLSLPCHPQMRDDDLDTVVTAVNSFRGC
jgi:dTDP-4-amino-4,6-dideoxygalactose transaminase